jgi:transposase
MAKLKEREKAIILRKEKLMSYGQIKKILKVSKSTLSRWLKNYPLPEEKIKELQRKGWEKSEASRERFINSMRKKKEKRLREIYEFQKKTLLPLNGRELFIAGLFLYWGREQNVNLQNFLFLIPTPFL